MTLEEYLAWEEQTPLRYEYVSGEVYAMTGSTVRHNLIVGNIVHALRPVARRHGCRVLFEAVKLRAAVDRVYYPDVMVACGKAADVELIVKKPSLVVEVTSRSTRGTDRREKLDAYQKIPSLRTYLIVAQRHRHVIAYTRNASDAWLREEFHGDGDVPVPFLDFELSLEQIYEDVALPPLTVREDREWEYWEDKFEVEELPI